jgi:hypothetical protein
MDIGLLAQTLADHRPRPIACSASPLSWGMGGR